MFCWMFTCFIALSENVLTSNLLLEIYVLDQYWICAISQLSIRSFDLLPSPPLTTS